ncbi:unnamed protein product [Alternaria alternata]
MVTDQFTEPDYRVALDFGTTYTSIAFVRKGEREINTIDQWDGDRCHHSNGRQVPTESVYRPASRLHGYEAQRWLEESQPDDAVIAHIKRMKLLLDDTGCVWTQDAKSEVAKGIQKLQAHHLIDSEQDIIRHILKYYFRHIKRTLEMAEGFHDGNSVELTFSVPVCWSTMANAKMSKCIETAMRESGFGVIHDQRGSSVNLFMVNEAEAGASYALDSSWRDGVIKRRGVFLLVDSGGGTTDLGLYRTTEPEPLRLEREINPPSGAMCGSSDLNERMRARALLDLRDQGYLTTDRTIETIVDEFIMPAFENEHKRSFRWRDRSQRFRYPILGLQASQNNRRIQKGDYVLNYDDMWSIFEPSLETIRDSIVDQIQSARLKDIVVKSIVVLGGFGDSPALREYLRIWLNEYNHKNGLVIEMKFALACTEDYWQRTSKHNKGKTTQLGKVVFDVTDLKEHHVKVHKEKGLCTQKWKIRVEVLLQIEIIGRDLKFFVRWPANREGKLLPASRSSFSLAAAFKPGTE